MSQANREVKASLSEGGFPALLYAGFDHITLDYPWRSENDAPYFSLAWRRGKYNSVIFSHFVKHTLPRLILHWIPHPCDGRYKMR